MSSGNVYSGGGISPGLGFGGNALMGSLLGYGLGHAFTSHHGGGYYGGGFAGVGYGGYPGGGGFGYVQDNDTYATNNYCYYYYNTAIENTTTITGGAGETDGTSTGGYNESTAYKSAEDGGSWVDGDPAIACGDFWNMGDGGDFGDSGSGFSVMGTGEW